MNDFLLKWLKLSLVALVGCGFLAMAIYAFVQQDEIRNAQIEPPLVTAPEDAVKRRPDQPGGMEIPNRDKLVFDLLDSDTIPNAGANAADVIAAATPTPVEGSTAAMAQLQPQVPMQDMTLAAPVQPVAVQEAAPQPEQPAQAQSVAQPAQTAPAPKAEPKPEPKPEPQVAKASGGSWGVQLAAVGSKADGEKAAAKLAKQFSALKGLSPRVVAAPNGKHFRIQFVGAASRAAAQAVCGKLGSKQPCFPISGK